MPVKLTNIHCPNKPCKGTLEKQEFGYVCTQCARQFSAEEVTKMRDAQEQARNNRKIMKQRHPIEHWEQFRSEMIDLFHLKGTKAVVETYHININTWYKVRDKWVREGHLKQGQTDTRPIIARQQIPVYPEFDDSWDNDVKIAWLQYWPGSRQ